MEGSPLSHIPRRQAARIEKKGSTDRQTENRNRNKKGRDGTTLVT